MPCEVGPRLGRRVQERQRGAIPLDSWVMIERDRDDLGVRLATIDDQEVVLDLLAQGARYARIRGSDQWPDRFPDELIRSGSGATRSTLVLSMA